MIVSPEDGWQGTAAPRGNDGMGRKKNLLSCFGQLKTVFIKQQRHLCMTNVHQLD